MAAKVPADIGSLREAVYSTRGNTRPARLICALESRNVTREFRAMLAAAGVPPVRFHHLRHTAATLLLSQGVDPRTIMETLGHSQISLTLNTYSHVLPALQADAAAKLDAVLSS